MVGSPFQLFKDQSLIYGYKSKKSRLVLGECVPNTNYIWFELGKLPSGCLTGISLAISCRIQPQNGMMGIEIVENANRIIASSSVEALKINNHHPVSFEFDLVSIDTSINNYSLRVFLKNVDVPIKMYVFQNRIKKHSKPFVYFKWEELN
ncbi:hypothetical protein XI25_04520 [Paenibacillus sp. DMB20]|nr:hypothetical protein XI25_04520 [Paenibacillus sp. DMB20]